MSVDGLKEYLVNGYVAMYDGCNPNRIAAETSTEIDKLIAAVRADERTRILAKFRGLIAEYRSAGRCSIPSEDLKLVIHTLETTNQDE